MVRVARWEPLKKSLAQPFGVVGQAARPAPQCRALPAVRLLVPQQSTGLGGTEAVTREP
jgi:hypothetical protein